MCAHQASNSTVSESDQFEDSKALKVSLVIPVHNGGDMFRRCLEAVRAAEPAADEVIVVADGETDGSGELAQQFGAKVIYRQTAGGPAIARNIGARAANGDILFFIDADVSIDPQTIGRVIQKFSDQPDISALIGSYDDSPSAANFLSQYKNLFHHYTHQQSREEASTFWGACGAIRRNIFFEIGGFDERYTRPCIEDIELGYRVKKYGHKIRLMKELQIKHMKRWDTLSLLKADFFYRALPWVDLILNEGRLVNDLNLKISSRVSVISVYLLSLLIPLGLLYSVWFFVPAALLMALIFGLNWSLYRFFKDKRGLGFALLTIPWHWFYFLYSGLAFFIGVARRKIRKNVFLLRLLGMRKKH